jgi:ABC-2 type transport system permease protein
MRWLLIKDLQILKRSPLLVTLLIAYPLLSALLIGLALSRGPEKPRVAIYNETPASERIITIGGKKIDTFSYIDRLLTTIDAVHVRSASEALAKVRSGDALGAVVIPRNATASSARGWSRPVSTCTTTPRTRSRRDSSRPRSSHGCRTPTSP